MRIEFGRDDGDDDGGDYEKQALKAPAIQDDADGHLIYRTGDILHNRCSCKLREIYLLVLFTDLLLLETDAAPTPRQMHAFVLFVSARFARDARQHLPRVGIEFVEADLFGINCSN